MKTISDKVHLIKPTGGSSCCGIDSYKIYTQKGVELAGMNRLAEVNCLTCLEEGIELLVEKQRDIGKEIKAIADAACKLD